MLREPAAHVLSMFNHCEHGSSKSTSRHGYSRAPRLDAWLDLFARGVDDAQWRNISQSVCEFFPTNLQAATLYALDGRARDRGWAAARAAGPKGALAHGLAALADAASVGVTRWMDASLCLAHYALHGSSGDVCNTHSQGLELHTRSMIWPILCPM